MSDTGMSYNDGNWHGWNGCICPLHPNTVIDAIWYDPIKCTVGLTESILAYEPCAKYPYRLAWGHVVAFRVTKEHKEPREWTMYVRNDNGVTWDDGNASEVIKVREVTE